MRLLRMVIEYDGTEYVGWQFQREGISIQGLLEQAIGRVTGTPSRVTGAGRTDAGVHALAQVAAFTTASTLPDDVLFRALNANLPRDIRIRRLGPAPEGFHPRHHAIAKRYSYLIQTGRPVSVFAGRWAWSLPCRLDTDAMREEMAAITGTHDFSSFQASGCTARHAVRTIRKIEIIDNDQVDFLGLRLDANVIRLSVEADGFLRHMVRNIAGLAVDVGHGKVAPGGVRAVLEARDRRVSSPTAPARGLFLERVFYPDDFFTGLP